MLVAHVGCDDRIGPGRTWTGEAVTKPASEYCDGWSIQQLDDRHDDAQVVFSLGTQLQRDERVDPELVKGQLNVQPRRRQTEFAGRLIAQVRLEEPLALLPVRATQRVV